MADQLEKDPMVHRAQLGLDLEVPRQERTGARESFHVRSHVTAQEAAAGEARALGQDAAILEWFVWRPRFRAVPSDVAASFPQWPITSIRRALTNLTKRGRLVHYPADRRPGPRGARESTWGLA